MMRNGRERASGWVSSRASERALEGAILTSFGMRGLTREHPNYSKDPVVARLRRGSASSRQAEELDRRKASSLQLAFSSSVWVRPSQAYICPFRPQTEARGRALSGEATTGRRAGPLSLS